VSELRESLDQALRDIVPGDPPVAEAMRRGKAIRVRRLATAVASVAAVALFAAFGYPALTHGQAPHPPPVQHRQPTVTDLPPGPAGHAPGLIAGGLMNGKAWQVVTGKPGTNGLPKGQQCFGAFGPAFGADGNTTQCIPTQPPDAADPVGFTEFTCGGAVVSVGRVRADVQYAVVDLADGTQLKLIPATVYGTRYVAFPAPLPLSVDSATAYLRNGRYLTAIPFTAPQGVVLFGMWLQPGQRGLPRATGLVASGRADGATWAVYVYAGPWGWCIDDSATLECLPLATPLATQLLGTASSHQGVIFGAAAAGVSYLRVTLAGGGALRVGVTAVGSQRFFAFYLRKGQTMRKWTAYDAAGRPVASGTVPAHP
jgi:hypothetical protein